MDPMDAAPPTSSIPPGPMHDRRIPPVSISSAFSVGHSVMGSNYGVILGATVLLLVIQFVVGLLAGAIDMALVGPNSLFQPVSLVAQVLVLTPLAIGPGMLAAMRFRDGSGDINTVFIGFSRYPQVVLIGTITTLATWAVMFVVGVTGFGLFNAGSPIGLALGLAVTILAIGVLIYLAVRFWFGALVCVDPLGPQPGAIDALLTSWRITSGRALILFLTGLLVGIIVAASIMLLVLPMIFYGLPLAAAMTGVLYALVAHHAGLVPMSGYDTCPHCGYSLQGLAVTTCPECGAGVPRVA